ncbi:MAG: hypothetical protein P8J86_12585 [Phycisphaerales bacterium]|nr:hypothetical protein [Phycisphaerales bacterium]
MASAIVLSPVLFGQEISISAKQLAAPPQDIMSGRLRLPDPAFTGTWSEYGMLSTVIEAGKGSRDQGVCQIPLAGAADIVVLGKELSTWKINLIDGQGQRHDLLSAREAVLGDGGPLGSSLDALRVSLADLVGPQVTLDLTTNSQQTGRHAAVVLVDDDVPVGMYASLNHHLLHVGQKVQIDTQFYNTQNTNSQTVRTQDRQRLNLAIVESWADVWHANGHYERLDSVGESGMFSLDLRSAGDVTVMLSVRAIASDGRAFLRTTTHLIHVEEPNEKLSGFASMVVGSDGDLQILIGVDGSREKVLLAAELWSTSIAGEASPVCWAGGMTPRERGGHDQSIRRLRLDLAWLSGFDGQSTLSLKNIRIQDPDSLVPLDIQAEMTLDVSDAVWEVASRVDAQETPTREQLMGQPGKVRFAGHFSDHSSRAVGGHNLMLMHGYCSDGVSFEQSDYSGQLQVFWDPDVNRTHDEFALEIWNQGLNSKSYGLLGHSQGGTAALHLYAYYWSGVDWAQGGRLVQTLGSPFEGTALAGAIAALGEVFGIQCGTNFDMTYDGAALWLSGIPTWARQETYTSTSSFVDEWFSYDYCHLASDLLLSDPDDGVVESWSGRIDGGNDLGHIEGWCHIGGMVEPPECTDPARNSDFNESAAR